MYVFNDMLYVFIVSSYTIATDVKFLPSLQFSLIIILVRHFVKHLFAYTKDTNS